VGGRETEPLLLRGEGRSTQKEVHVNRYVVISGRCEEDTKGRGKNIISILNFENKHNVCRD
jgi:hypothetical protein